MKKWISTILIFLLIFICTDGAFAYDVPEYIKVGLCYSTNARSQIDIVSSDGFNIGKYNGYSFTKLFETNATSVTCAVTYGTLYISYGYSTFDEANSVANGGFVLYTNNSFYKAFSEPKDGFDAYELSEGAMAVRQNGSAFFVMNSMELGILGRGGFTNIDGYSYRGGAEMMYYGKGLMTVINVVSFNDYLCGVVPKEMPVSFEKEALKAQAVCARNYAMMNIGRFNTYGFDVTDDVLCQVYGGLSAETEISNQAVRETNSDLLMYGNEPVTTYFSSMSGGKTEACKDVWSADIPYLCGVDDPYEDTDNIKGGTWEVMLTPADIESSLASWGVNVGSVTNMYVSEKTGAGGVKKLTVEGTDGSYTFEKDECRNVFTLRSQLYTVSRPGVKTTKTVYTYVPYSVVNTEKRYEDSSVIVNAYKFPTLHRVYADSVLTTYKQETVEEVSETGENVYILSGRGYGHRLGLSQWGAQGMAQAGFNYEQILLHYYPGSYLQKN